jgi:hypothetical protein
MRHEARKRPKGARAARGIEGARGRKPDAVRARHEVAREVLKPRIARREERATAEGRSKRRSGSPKNLFF